MSDLRVDVLVVGLGPAGARAAAEAASAGFRVLAVERRPRPGEPVQCAEFIPAPAAAYARSPGVRQQPVFAMETELPSGVCRRSAMMGLMLDRGRFDRALVAVARKAGAEIRTASRLRALEADSSRALLSGPGRGAPWVRYRLLIAADGPRSAVARHLGLSPLPCVVALQYRLRLQAVMAETRIYLGARYPGGYGWLFPRVGHANLGVGLIRGRGVSSWTALAGLHRDLVARGLVRERVLARTGGMIPVGGLRQPLRMGSIIFAGDAAGLTHPVTGAGIAAAVQSGEWAGRAAAAWLGGDAQGLRYYAEELRDCYAPALNRALRRRRELMAAWPDAGCPGDALLRRGWVGFPEYHA